MNFGCFATLVKAHCINRRINNMELVNGLLEGIIQYANLTNKNGEELRFDKYESSKLLNNKNNIPLKIVDALRREGIADSIRPSFESFVADNIDNGLIEDLVASLQNQIEKDPGFGKEEMVRLLDLKEDAGGFLLEIMIHALKESNLKISSTTKAIQRNGSNYIRLADGDIFRIALETRNDEGSIVVIPVNTRFDTHVTVKAETVRTPMVSINTIHGDFINRMKKKGVTEEALTERIKNNLKLSGYDVTGYPNSKTFPVGTIAAIEQSGVVYYLLAMSTFDDLNRAHCTNEELGVAIEKLLDYYDVHGQGSILYLPLLGTGLSRTGLSDRASYNIILEGIGNRFTPLQGKYTIVTKPESFGAVAKEEE